MTALGSKAKAVTLLWLAFCWQALTAQEVKVNNIYGAEGNGFYWKVYIDEGASRLQLIKCVEYTLYPSFPNPVREVCDPRDHFALQERGRGEFTIVVRIKWRDREPTVQSYILDLHSRPVPKIADLPGFGNRILRNIQPVGLAFLSSDLVIGDKGNARILLVHCAASTSTTSTCTQSGTVSVVADIHQSMLVNIAAPQMDGQKVIVAVHNPVGLPDGLRMYHVSGGQDTEGYWNVPFGLSLVACALYEDANTRTIYVANNMATLFKVDFRDGHASGTQIAEIGLPNEDSVEAIAADPSHSRLFAFDYDARGRGYLYQVDLQDVHAHPHRLNLVGALGHPVAIAVTAAGDRLYAIEGNRIRVIRLDTSPIEVKVFLQDQRFHSLSALAIQRDGRIWVGDKDRHAVYEISPDGQVEGVLSAQ